MKKVIQWAKWIWNLIPYLHILIWEYIVKAITGRMIIHEVAPGLYQSSKFNPKDWTKLVELRIESIIDLEGSSDELPKTVTVSNYKYWPIKDEPKLPDLTELNETALWGYCQWKSMGRNVLVHCAAGHNRSGLVNGVILVKAGMRGKDASELIQRKVPGSLANIVFREYLENL